MMADDKNKVPLFHGSNFSNWKGNRIRNLDGVDFRKTHLKLCEDSPARRGQKTRRQTAEKQNSKAQPECRLNKLRSEHQQKQLKTRNANVATNNASNEGESEFSNQHSFSAYLKGNVKSTVWCLDSGASEHLVKSDNRVNKYAKTGASCVY
jgi:hypothetical protein